MTFISEKSRCSWESDCHTEVHIVTELPPVSIATDPTHSAFHPTFAHSAESMSKQCAPKRTFIAQNEREEGFTHVLLITTGSVASVKAPLIVKQLLQVGDFQNAVIHLIPLSTLVRSRESRSRGHKTLSCLLFRRRDRTSRKPCMDRRRRVDGATAIPSLYGQEI